MTQVSLYRVCDLVIESNLPLLELPAVEGRNPECRFELLPAGEGYADEIQWFHQWHFKDDDTEPWLRFARCDDGYLLRFPSQGEFLLSCDASYVRCRPLPGTSESTIRHLLLDQIIPLIMSRRERLVLHASAVLTSQGAIAFAGTSGQGKSTLAASFGQDGFALVSDDCLVLRDTPEGWTAIPSYPGVRLWPETADCIYDIVPETAEVAHYTTKRRVGDPSLVPFTETPSLVWCLYFLDSDDETGQSGVIIAPLSPQDAFMKLVRFAYNLDITDKEFLKCQFRTIAQLTAQVKCYRLCYPRDFPALPMVRQTILQHPQEGDDYHAA